MRQVLVMLLLAMLCGFGCGDGGGGLDTTVDAPVLVDIGGDSQPADGPLADIALADQTADTTSPDAGVDALPDMAIDTAPDVAIDTLPADTVSPDILPADTLMPDTTVDSVPWVTITGTVSILQPLPATVTVDAMTVSLVGNPANSTTTNAQGNFAISVPPNTVVFLRASKTGVLSAIRGTIIGTQSKVVNLLSIHPDWLKNTVYDPLGLTEPVGMATAFSLYTIVDANGAPVPAVGGETDSIDQLSVGGTATFQNGGVAVLSDVLLAGQVKALLHFDIAPGTSTVFVTPVPNPGETCLSTESLPGRPFEADAVTQIDVACLVQ